jgi:1-acyl-sn-glycerol-3-phosphate acyltransferase
MATRARFQGYPGAKTEAGPVLHAIAASYRGSQMDAQLSDPKPDAKDRPTAVFRMLAALSRPIARCAFRLTVSGLEHVPEGGYVLCANHLSGLDPWALSIPLLPRQPRNVAKAELFVWPFRSLLGAVGLFPVRRGDGDGCAVATAIRHAKAGRVVVVFPEGARRRNRALPPRRGAARVALAAGVPLVPAAVRGTDRASMLGRWEVAFGAPIPLDDLRSLPPKAAAAEATRRLWADVVELELTLARGFEQRRSGSYATAPAGGEVQR